MLIRRTLSLLVLFTLQPAVCAAQTPSVAADVVVFNGKIITNTPAFEMTEAIAARGEQIIAVGSTADVLKLAGPRTRRVDLQGRTVIPGLIDTHTHALDWARSVVRDELDLSYPKVAKLEDVVKAVAARAQKLKPGEWIVGTSWDDAKLAEKRYITRRDLDAVTPSNPVYLMHVSGHLAVANSTALKLAGVTAETPDPQGGVVEKDAQGQLTGVVKDTAMGLVGNVLPAQTREDAIKALAHLSQAAAEVGLTTIHDIAIAPDDFAAYQQAYRQGILKIRVHMGPLVNRPQDVERLKLMGVHTGFGDAHLKFGPVKIFTDGGMGARTIAIYPPPVQNEPQNTGLLLWKSEDLERTQQQLAAMGWQLATHAIGDRAIDQALDSYAKVARLHPGRDLRNRIIHCGVATPAIQTRLKELNVLVDSNPPFVYWIGSWFEKYGAERVRWSYPAKSYFDRGIIVSGGSDVYVTPISPWWGIWAAVVRRELKSGHILAPEERVSVRQALQMYTSNGAYAGFEEKLKGTLEAGKLADFVVLDRNPLEIPSDELKDVKVLATFVGGQPIFDTLRAGNQ
ncbi:MAG: amidohydrolase [Pyrinomonadaceae bacterium]